MAEERTIEEKIRRSIANAREMFHKEVIFPETRAFGQLFHNFKLISEFKNYESRRVAEWIIDGEPLPDGRVPKGVGTAGLLSFCRVSANHCLDVMPWQEVIDCVPKVMLMSKDYEYNFEIIVRDNGVALVTLKYNLILGDRWLAFIDATTIPGLGNVLHLTDGEGEALEKEEDMEVETVKENDNLMQRYAEVMNQYVTLKSKANDNDAQILKGYLREAHSLWSRLSDSERATLGKARASEVENVFGPHLVVPKMEKRTTPIQPVGVDANRIHSYLSRMLHVDSLKYKHCIMTSPEVDNLHREMKILWDKMSDKAKGILRHLSDCDLDGHYDTPSQDHQEDNRRQRISAVKSSNIQILIERTMILLQRRAEGVTPIVDVTPKEWRLYPVEERAKGRYGMIVDPSRFLTHYVKIAVPTDTPEPFEYVWVFCDDLWEVENDNEDSEDSEDEDELQGRVISDPKLPGVKNDELLSFTVEEIEDVWKGGGSTRTSPIKVEVGTCDVIYLRQKYGVADSTGKSLEIWFMLSDREKEHVHHLVEFMKRRDDRGN